MIDLHCISHGRIRWIKMPQAQKLISHSFVSADWVVFLAHYWRSQELANAATETDSGTSNATECAIDNLCIFALLPDLVPLI